MLFSHVECRLLSNVINTYKTNKHLPSSLLLNLIGKRLYLTEAYKCKEAWNQRLKNHLVSKINLDDFFVELSKKFVAKRKVGCVDVDLFTCSITNGEHFEELENLLHRFRRSRQTVHTLESTHYAFVNLCLNFEKYDLLLKVLNDRNNYGIFPSNFSSNLMMDEFLKHENYRDATKIAILMMLQEDMSNPISQRLALHSCLSYIKKPQPEPWNPVEETEGKKDEQSQDVEEDDEEDVYVRVPYLRNPYFDDHFDLIESNHLIGKTLYFAGKEFPDVVGRSSQIIGLGLYQKFEKSSQILDNFLKLKDNKPILLTEAVAKFKESLDTSKVNKEVKSNLIQKLDLLQSSGLTSNESLEEKVNEKLEEIKQFEKEDIENQKKQFIQWEEDRDKALKREMEELRRKERIIFIKEKKKELFEKEQLLFFFENWNKIEMELNDIEREQRNKPITHEVEEYIPPEIVKKRST